MCDLENGTFNLKPTSDSFFIASKVLESLNPNHVRKQGEYAVYGFSTELTSWQRSNLRSVFPRHYDSLDAIYRVAVFDDLVKVGGDMFLLDYKCWGKRALTTSFFNNICPAYMTSEQRSGLPYLADQIGQKLAGQGLEIVLK